MIELAKNIIKQFEGLHLSTYYCPAGLKTIGYGHVIKSYEKISNKITVQQAEELLEEDIRKAEVILYKYCSVPLTENQQASLISFIFNCGSGAFQSSTLRQKLNRKEYLAAADELLKWVNCKGIKLSGLIKRRNLEREVFLTEPSRKFINAYETENINSTKNIISSSIKTLFSKLSIP
ncbi:MAG TPA: lysozyme [Rickettsia endosymbiont of Pyrocoelia pectoralis]|nr:lysozyme [Rickettsia endosymbiont of Pyrocoelia pectoralis]